MSAEKEVNLYDPEVAENSSNDRRRRPADIEWTAPEFIEHHHGFGWYSGLILATAVIAVGVYFATKDYFATSVIPIVGIIVWVFAGHKPGQAKYEISASGLSINGKNYPYTLYKSFTIAREDAYSSLNFTPLKRFMPPVTAYFEPKDESRITNALGNYLPYENRPIEAIDRLSRRLRL
ncbi:MAG TPA: hypothetical protein VHD84_00935 [Candidatus Saccharimonadales bacterium]|nr:hypothetical protein [Candidatus Saccharimonadales bacterium]